MGAGSGELEYCVPVSAFTKVTSPEGWRADPIGAGGGVWVCGDSFYGRAFFTLSQSPCTAFGELHLRSYCSSPLTNRRSKAFGLLQRCPVGASPIATHCPPPWGAGGARSAGGGGLFRRGLRAPIWGEADCPGRATDKARSLRKPKVFEWGYRCQRTGQRQGRGHAPSPRAATSPMPEVVPKRYCWEGDTPAQTLPAWRYPMESRFHPSCSEWGSNDR